MKTILKFPFQNENYKPTTIILEIDNPVDSEKEEDGVESGYGESVSVLRKDNK